MRCLWFSFGRWFLSLLVTVQKTSYRLSVVCDCLCSLVSLCFCPIDICVCCTLFVGEVMQLSNCYFGLLCITLTFSLTWILWFICENVISVIPPRCRPSQPPQWKKEVTHLEMWQFSTCIRILLLIWKLIQSQMYVML